MEETGEEVEEQKKNKKTKKKKKKSVLRKIIGWAVYIAIIVALVYFIPKILSRTLGTDTPIAAITSRSMWPALKVGDLVFVKAVNVSDIEVNDIVVYKNEEGFTIHRVIDINKNKIITKGDAHNISDEPLAFNDVIGKALE